MTLNEAKALLEELGRSQRHSNHTPRLNTVFLGKEHNGHRVQVSAVLV